MKTNPEMPAPDPSSIDMRSKQVFVLNFEAKSNFLSEETRQLLIKVLGNGAVIEVQKSGQLENGVAFDVCKIYYTEEMLEADTGRTDFDLNDFGNVISEKK